MPPRGDELRALFRGQWANGMMPHMIFAEGTHDVGSRRVWQSRRHPDAPRDIATSCITQPPLAAIAVERVAAASEGDEGRSLLAELFPKLLAHHEWLFRERRLDATALVTLIHPWECGLDSTPPWMLALRTWRMPWWLRTAERLHLARILRSLRYDTRYVPAVERPTDDDGLRMLALAVHAKKYGFELHRMPRDSSLLVEDVAFNAMFAAANRSLAAIAESLGTALPDGAGARHRPPRVSPSRSSGTTTPREYCSRDAVTGARLRQSTIATFLPLWAGAAGPERAARLLEAAATARAGTGPRSPCRPCRSTPPSSRSPATGRGPPG